MKHLGVRFDTICCRVEDPLRRESQSISTWPMKLTDVAIEAERSLLFFRSADVVLTRVLSQTSTVEFVQHSDNCTMISTLRFTHTHTLRAPRASFCSASSGLSDCRNRGEGEGEGLSNSPTVSYMFDDHSFVNKICDCVVRCEIRMKFLSRYHTLCGVVLIRSPAAGGHPEIYFSLICSLGWTRRSLVQRD